MSRKDYQNIARVFAETREFAIAQEQSNLWYGIVTEMATMLKKDNTSFDPIRFYAACKNA